MKVALDISHTRIARDGTAVYIEELLPALHRVAPDAQLVTPGYAPCFGRAHRVLRAWDTLWRETIWTQYQLPRDARAAGAEVLHVPGVHAPFRPPCPMVLTIYDLHCSQHPEDYNRWHGASHTYCQDRVVYRAARIIAISEHVRHAVLARYPDLDAQRVVAIPLGVNARFRTLAPEALAAVREKYELSRPFVLSVATLAPHKNLDRLVAAFAQIAGQVPHDLVLAGGGGWRYSLARASREAGLGARLRHVGFVPAADLPALYNAAAVFAFPSLYEGFGLPPLEAMACGTPVVTSNVTSLPEVVGDAALKVDPYSTAAIAQGLLDLIRTPALRADLVAQGRQRAAAFTWDRCATATWQVYQAAAAERPAQPGRHV